MCGFFFFIFFFPRGPLTDTQRIDDEINRQVALCTCRQKFKVFQVGEGKYRVSHLSRERERERRGRPTGLF